MSGIEVSTGDDYRIVVLKSPKSPATTSSFQHLPFKRYTRNRVHSMNSKKTMFRCALGLALAPARIRKQTIYPAERRRRKDSRNEMCSLFTLSHLESRLISHFPSASSSLQHISFSKSKCFRSLAFYLAHI